jgi:hypothetical protein
MFAIIIVGLLGISVYLIVKGFTTGFNPDAQTARWISIYQDKTDKQLIDRYTRIGIEFNNQRHTVNNLEMAFLGKRGYRRTQQLMRQSDAMKEGKAIEILLKARGLMK